MKDSLRYYIDEGFIAFYAYPNSKGETEYFARIVGDYTGLFRKDSSTSPDTLQVTRPDGKEQLYDMNANFFLDYAEVWNTKEVAHAAAARFSADMGDAVIEFRSIKKELAKS